MRVKHPLEYNDELETKADVNKTWSERELQDLARLQIRLGPCKRINIELQKQFEHRTVQAIAAVRKKDSFRNLVEELRSEMENSTSPVPEAAACVSPRPEGELASHSHTIRDSIDSFCTSHTPCPDTLDGVFAGYLLAFESAGVDLAFNIFAANLAKMFPQRKPKTRVGKNKSRPQMKRCRSKKPRDVRRRKEYWAAQQYLKSNFSTGTKIVLEGKSFAELRSEEPDPLEVFNFYSKKLGTAVHIEPSDRNSQALHAELLEPFTPEEVEAILGDLKPGVAPGPDSWLTCQVIRKLGPTRLALLYNTWVLGCKIPESVQGCRSLLIPKSAEASKSLDDWRPLTIGSLFMRVFAKALQARLERCIVLSARQKAFIPLDGVATNVFTLRELILRARASRSELNIGFVDVSKAFDSIPHTAIWNALARRGVPSVIINLIREMYARSYTAFEVAGTRTSPIPIRSGVKQGCPLSPFLFNLVLDDLISSLKDSKIGVSLDSLKVNCLAFADDIVLIADSKYDLQAGLNLALEFFRTLSMTINVKKCETLRIVPAHKVKSMKIDTKSVFYIGNSRIRTCGFDRPLRYLGVQITPKGDLVYPRASLELMLGRLTRARIRPEQRIRMLRQTVLPRICFSLRLAMVPQSKLQALDAILRKWVKKTVHLPPGSPTAFFYLPLRSGGLGLVELARTIPLRTAKCLYKLQCSNDQTDVLVASAMLGRYSKTIEKLRLLPSDIESSIRNRPLALLESFHRTAWGLDHQAIVESAKTLGWVCEGRLLQGGEYVQAVQVYSGNLPTRLALHRGRQVDNSLLMCRRCHRCKETTAHIMNDCGSVHRAIVDRHNAVCRTLSSILSKRPGTQVHSEVLIKVNMEGFRPDMIVLENSRIYVLEVTVPFDQSLAYLNSRFQAKYDKYNTPEIKSSICKHFNMSFDQSSVEVLPFVVGSRGVLPSRSVNTLRTLGILKFTQMLQAQSLRGSLRVWNIFKSNNNSLQSPRAAGLRGDLSNAAGRTGRPPDSS